MNYFLHGKLDYVEEFGFLLHLFCKLVMPFFKSLFTFVIFVPHYLCAHFYSDPSELPKNDAFC
jgi:hypothetical protein